MSETEKFPQTLHQAIKYFAKDDRAFEYMKAVRWPDGKVACPQCGATNVTWLAKARVWKCYAKHERPTFFAQDRNDF